MPIPGLRASSNASRDSRTGRTTVESASMSFESGIASAGSAPNSRCTRSVAPWSARMPARRSQWTGATSRAIRTACRRFRNGRAAVSATSSTTPLGVRRPAELIATTVFSRHHEQIAGLQFLRRYTPGTWIIGAGPTECTTFLCAGRYRVRTYLIGTLRHVRDAIQSCVPSPAQPRSHRPDGNVDLLRRSRGNELQQRFQISGCVLFHVSRGNVSTPDERNVRGRTFATMKEQADVRVRRRRRPGLRPEIEVGGHQNGSVRAGRSKFRCVDAGFSQRTVHCGNAEVHFAVPGNLRELLPRLAETVTVHRVISVLRDLLG